MVEMVVFSVIYWGRRRRMRVELGIWVPEAGISVGVSEVGIAGGGNMAWLLGPRV